MCTGCPLWLHSSEAPHTHQAQNTLKDVTHTGGLQQGNPELSVLMFKKEKKRRSLLYPAFLYINGWTDQATGHLSRLSK